MTQESCKTPSQRDYKQKVTTKYKQKKVSIIAEIQDELTTNPDLQ